MAEPYDSNARDYYDALSEAYDRQRASVYHQMVDDLELGIVAPYAAGGRVLELGCGTGLLLSRLAEVAAEAIGIDLSEQMAGRARAKGLDVRVANLTSLPFADARFDLTYSFKVLAHVADPARAIAEAARVTRPGGHVVFDLYNRWSLRFLARTVAGPRSVGPGRTEADVFTRWDSPRTVERLLPPDLRLVEIRGVRVLTPFAAVHRWRLVGPALRRAEELASRSPLRYTGGFLVVVLQKR